MINRQGTKRILKIILFSLVACIVAGYAIFVSYDFVEGPRIVITSPKNGTTFATSSVEIQGYAQHINSINLNGRDILIDNKGNFNEHMLLAPGYNVFSFKIGDKFGRAREYRLELVYKVN